MINTETFPVNGHGVGLLKTDLRDFFPSITCHRVMRVFASKVRDDIGELLAELR